jgi:hypothetical protein
MEHPKSIILTNLKNQNFQLLASMNLSQILYVINEVSPDYIQTLKLTESFIIQLYNQLITNKKQPADKNLIVQIIKRLSTIVLFFNLDVTDDFIIFIKNKLWLFDNKLWLDLVLNPDYIDDINKINQMIKLNYNDILPIFKPINYYDCNYSIFEYILLGKMIYSNNKLKHIRFFNLEAIIKLIEQTNASIYLNDSLLIILNELKKNPSLDQVYLDTVIGLLTKRYYLIS